MSHDNGVPEAPPEPLPEDIPAVLAMKEVFGDVLSDMSLTLLERRNAFESLRSYIDEAIDILDQQIANGGS